MTKVTNERLINKLKQITTMNSDYILESPSRFHFYFRNSDGLLTGCSYSKNELILMKD